MKFGAHMSTAGGAWKALQRGVEIGCNIVQIFVNFWNIDPRYSDVSTPMVRLACIQSRESYRINYRQLRSLEVVKSFKPI